MGARTNTGKPLGLDPVKDRDEIQEELDTPEATRQRQQSARRLSKSLLGSPFVQDRPNDFKSTLG